LLKAHDSAVWKNLSIMDYDFFRAWQNDKFTDEAQEVVWNYMDHLWTLIDTEATHANSVMLLRAPESAMVELLDKYKNIITFQMIKQIVLSFMSNSKGQSANQNMSTLPKGFDPLMMMQMMNQMKNLPQSMPSESEQDKEINMEEIMALLKNQ
jgi:hypothetical protein